MLKKSHSYKIFDQGTAFLVTSCCMEFPKVQSSCGMKVPVTYISMVLSVSWVIDLDVCPSLMWRSLMSFLNRAVADNALLLLFHIEI